MTRPMTKSRATGLNPRKRGPKLRSSGRDTITGRTPVKDVESYLARVPRPARGTLEELRRLLRAAAPKATETISYQLPTLRYLGNLVGFGATAKHCALYVMSSRVLAPFRDELSGYDTSTGTIRFPPGAPLPAGLVRRIVRARVVENEQRAKAKAARAAAAGAAKPSRRKPAKARRDER